eukprot:10176984-Ditylum_brightwellii.AAC.1
MKVSHAKAAQKLLTTPKKTASDSNRLPIFSCGTWGNNKDGALQIALMSILFQVGGHISEGCAVIKINLKVEKQNASTFAFNDLARKLYDTNCKVTSHVSKEWQALCQHCVLDTWSSKYKDTFDAENEDTTMISY